jgi:cytoskeleton protein RodZ
MLIAATIVWWLQQGKLSTETTTALDQQEAAEEVILTYQKVVVAESPSGNDLSVEITPIESSPEASDLSQQSQPDMVEPMTEGTSTEQLPSAVDPEASQSTANEQSINAVTGDGQTRVEFTFSGDCWVNIFDASGERLAWGIKKSGYVMTIKGVAPFNVTLGKPELVTIKYNDNLLDISQFNRGNIAKFSLPLGAVQL